MRTLKVATDAPNAPEGFLFAVGDAKSAAEGGIVAWFKTERDAKLFAGAEKQIEQLKKDVERERRNSGSNSYRSYCRGLLCG